MQTLSPTQRIIWKTVGILVVLAIWYVATIGQGPYLFPSPIHTWDAFVTIVTNGSLFTAFTFTVARSAAGLAIAGVFGVIWGFATGYSQILDMMSRGIITMIMAVPPILVVVMSQVWFGTTSFAVVFVVALVISPMVIVGTRDAIREIDPDLLEMAEVFGLSRLQTIRHISVPAIAQPMLSSFVIAIGTCIRVTIMGELLLTTTGMGAGIRQAQINIETPQVFAYGIVIALVAVLFELALIKPMQKRRARLKALRNS